VIQFFHVTKSYGQPPRPILKDISFEISKGEAVCFYGPTGTGKSTVLKLLFGLERANDGQILVLGRNVPRLKSGPLAVFRRNIGFIFQDFKLFPERTVYENIALAMKVTGESPADIYRRTREVLKAVGLDQRHHLYPPMLSAGEQQRVCVARAIVNRPAILLSDEPTGNLDSDQSHEIMALHREINAMGTTLIVATHHPEILRQLKMRVFTIQGGSLKESGE